MDRIETRPIACKRYICIIADGRAHVRAKIKFTDLTQPGTPLNLEPNKRRVPNTASGFS